VGARSSRPDLAAALTRTSGSETIAAGPPLDGLGREGRTERGAASAEGRDTCRPGRGFTLPHVGDNDDATPLRSRNRQR